MAWQTIWLLVSNKILTKSKNQNVSNRQMANGSFRASAYYSSLWSCFIPSFPRAPPWKRHCFQGIARHDFMTIQSLLNFVSIFFPSEICSRHAKCRFRVIVHNSYSWWSRPKRQNCRLDVIRQSPMRKVSNFNRIPLIDLFFWMNFLALFILLDRIARRNDASKRLALLCTCKRK